MQQSLIVNGSDSATDVSKIDCSHAKWGGDYSRDRDTTRQAFPTLMAALEKMQLFPISSNARKRTR